MRMEIHDRASFRAGSGAKALNSCVRRNEGQPPAHCSLCSFANQPCQAGFRGCCPWWQLSIHKVLSKWSGYPRVGGAHTQEHSYSLYLPCRDSRRLSACTHLCVPSLRSLTWIAEYLLQTFSPISLFSLITVDSSLHPGHSYPQRESFLLPKPRYF